MVHWKPKSGPNEIFFWTELPMGKRKIGKDKKKGGEEGGKARGKSFLSPPNAQRRTKFSLLLSTRLRRIWIELEMEYIWGSRELAGVHAYQKERSQTLMKLKIERMRKTRRRRRRRQRRRGGEGREKTIRRQEMGTRSREFFNQHLQAFPRTFFISSDRKNFVIGETIRLEMAGGESPDALSLLPPLLITT